MRSFLTVLLSLLLAGCIDASKPSGGTKQTDQGQGTSASAVPLRVVLLRSDLGLGDGEWVREAEAALTGLSRTGRCELSTLGPPPQPLSSEAGADDVGLPSPGGSNPGQMTLSEATALLQDLPDCDLLVVSSGYLIPRLLELTAQQPLAARAVLLLDEQGMGTLPEELPFPLFRISYDIRPMAFAAGVAAGASAAKAHFGILYASDDPQGGLFARAAAAGAKYQSNGAWSELYEVPVEPSGIIEASVFQRSFGELGRQAGPHFKPDHYILALGRATPAITNALSKKPTNAYIVAAHADYRQVRPARVIGCALKLPGKALEAIFARLDPLLDPAGLPAALAAIADPDRRIELGLADGAVGFTGFDLYSRYNLDGEDIQRETQRVIAALAAGELQPDY